MDWLAEARRRADSGDPAAALAMIEARREPLGVDARLLAGILLFHLEQVEEARERFRQAVYLAPQDPECRSWLALALERLGAGEQAERERRNLVRLLEKHRTTETKSR